MKTHSITDYINYGLGLLGGVATCNYAHLIDSEKVKILGITITGVMGYNLLKSVIDSVRIKSKSIDDTLEDSEEGTIK